MTEALVGVDLQRIFADPSSAWATPGFERALAGTRRLLPAYEERTVLTRFVAPRHPQGAWVDYYRLWPFALVPDDDPLYDLVDGLDAAAARIVSEPTFGKWGAALEKVLGDADGMLLTGVSTDCCVLSTALGAADAGIRVRVATDACAGVTDADHERALAAMALYTPLIELTTVDEVLAAR